MTCNPYTFGGYPIVGGDAYFPFGGSMAEISSLLASDGDVFMASVSADVTKKICRQLGFAADVKKQIARSNVAAIVEAVRNGFRAGGINTAKAKARHRNRGEETGAKAHCNHGKEAQAIAQANSWQENQAKKRAPNREKVIVLGCIFDEPLGHGTPDAFVCQAIGSRAVDRATE